VDPIPPPRAAAAVGGDDYTHSLLFWWVIKIRRDSKSEIKVTVMTGTHYPGNIRCGKMEIFISNILLEKTINE
jgi:hypothetical protein